MNLKSLDTEQIKDYIQGEQEKGHSIREIVKEVAEERKDVTILCHEPKVAKQQILEVLK